MTITNNELFNIGGRLNKYENLNLEFCNRPNSIGIMSLIENSNKYYCVYKTIDMEYARFRVDTIPIEWTKQFTNFIDALEYAKIMYNSLNNNNEYIKKLTIV